MIVSRGRKTLASAAVVLLAGVFLRPAQAQMMAIAGGQTSRAADYAYTGIIDPLFDGKLGSGWFISPMLGLNRYSFKQNTTRFVGTQPSGSLGLGYSISGKAGSISLSVAEGYGQASISPYAPAGSVHGGQFFTEPEIWAQVPLAPWLHITANGGYLTGLRSYWFVTYAAATITPRISVGPEIDLGGGPNYRSQVVAARFNTQITQRLGVSLSLGGITNIPGSYHPYAGVGLTLPFQ